MSRKIKFRAWDKNNKGFINGFNMIGFSTGQGAPKRKLQRFSDEWNEEDIELMQYTDLKDIDNREIYEGDILESGYISPMTGQYHSKKFVIEYEKDGFMGKCISHTPFGDTWLRFIDKPKVIGNIFQNPKLLESETE